MKQLKAVLLTFLAVLVSDLPAYAANIKVTFDKPLSEKAVIIAVQKNGKQTLNRLSVGTKSIVLSTTNAQLFLRRQSGDIVAIAASKCAPSGSQCTSKTVRPFLKKGAFILAGTKKLATAQLLMAAPAKAATYKASVDSSISYNKAALIKNINAHGQKILGASSKALIGTRAVADDQDGDGLPNAFDSDNDGDGTLDNYDTNSSDKTDTTSSVFTLFSNFKADIGSSLNYQTTGLDTAKVDTLMSSIQTLAIQVAGSSGDTAELDCGALGYCSAGGTGVSLSTSGAFPGTAFGANDTDGDGFGELVKGGTGDFQLRTGASTTSIAGGDTLLQYTTSSTGVLSSYSGIVNFVFSSNPAIKSVSFDGGVTTQTIDYATTPILGSRNDCITVSQSDPIQLTITGWRPQRPGNSTAGEAAFVDIGNSLVTIDIPNPPCAVGSPSCGGNGPGNCIASAYSTTDTNLTSDPNGLKDTKADADTSAASTYSFTINLTSCLAGNTHGSPITWNTNEDLSIDLQFRSGYGDNAAQKICIRRQ